MSLRRRLFTLAGICVLPSVALLANDQFQLRRAREAEAHQQVLHLAQFEAAELQSMAQGARQFLGALAAHPVIRDLDRGACNTLLARLREGYPFYATISAANTAGDVVCTSTGRPVPSVAAVPGFSRTLHQGEFRIGDFLLSPATGRPVLPFTMPIRAEDGRISGVVAASLDLDWLTETLQAKLTPGTVLTVTDRDMRILMRYPGNERYQGQVMPERYHWFMRGDTPGTVDAEGLDGKPLIVGYVPLGAAPEGLYVGVALDRSLAFAALDRVTIIACLVILAGILLAVIGTSLVGRFLIERPVRMLLRAAERLREGDYRPPPPTAPDSSEFSRLGLALGDLALALDTRERARAEAEAQLRHLAATLEQRVEERTRELAEANRKLAAEAEERQRAERALGQAQKMEAVGRVAGGVAHDFNNLLTAVLGSLELAMRRVSEPRTLRLLEAAWQAGERGAKLTAQILAFTRKQDLATVPVDANEAIRRMEELLERTLGPTVRIELDLWPELWFAMADPVQLEVVLLNLAINARDAMPLGGRIRFGTRNATIGAEARHQGPEPGDYVALSVNDTGEGMTEEVRAKAFEPFFTTKGPGKGTGLGLAQVFGFARQAGGAATLDSGPGQGTTVTLFLPRSEAPPAGAAEAAQPPQPTGRLRVLLVDDDASVRDLAQAMLQELGHEVVPAGSAAAALERLRGDQGFDLLLTDFAMPEMTGAQLAESVAARYPALPVLIMTGYADTEALRPWLQRGHQLLHKPFQVDGMAAAIGTILRAWPGGAEAVPLRR